MRTRRRGAVHPPEHGASLLQYCVVLSLVALLVAGMVPLASRTLGPDIAQSICRSVYTALTADEEGAEEFCGAAPQPEDIAAPEDPPPTDADFEPGLCQVQAATESQGLRAQFIAILDGETVLTKIEFADGSVWYVAEPWERGLGATAGLGAAIPVDPYATTWVGLWGEGSYVQERGHSMIWTFDDAAEAEAFEQRLREETSIGSNAFAQGWNWAWDTVTGWFGADNDSHGLPEPDMEVDIHRDNVDIAAGPELVLPGYFLAPEWLEAGGGRERTVRTDHGGSLFYPELNGEGPTVISENHQVSGNMTVDGALVVGPGSGLGWSAGIRADRHEDGELQGIFLNASFDMEAFLEVSNPVGFGVRRMASLAPTIAARENFYGRRQNTYVYVTFDNDEERALGEQFLEDHSGYSGAFSYFRGAFRGDHGYLDEDPGPDADPWDRLLYDKAQVWQTTSTVDSSSDAYGMSGQLGAFPVGPFFPGHLGWNSGSTALSTDDAWYLGASQEDEDGVVRRPTIPHDDCIA